MISIVAMKHPRSGIIGDEEMLARSWPHERGLGYSTIDLTYEVVHGLGDPSDPLWDAELNPTEAPETDLVTLDLPGAIESAEVVRAAAGGAGTLHDGPVQGFVHVRGPAGGRVPSRETVGRGPREGGDPQRGDGQALHERCEDRHDPGRPQ